jgi:hypothetical protein
MTIEQIDVIKRMINMYPDHLRMALSAKGTQTSLYGIRCPSKTTQLRIAEAIITLVFWVPVNAVDYRSSFM